MNSTIVEKTVIEPSGTTTYFAVATSKPHPLAVTMSLTFEAYLTPWNSQRHEVEELQRQIEGREVNA